jgi:uncharacterized iron-regulated membrane protein
MHIESPPLSGEHTNRDVDADLDADRVHWRSGTSRRASGFNNTQFASEGPSNNRRLRRSLAHLSLAVLIGVAATLAWQSYGGEAVRAWAPSLSWLLPVSTMKPPAPAVTSAELQAQLKPVALDLAIVRRSVEQLASNQDQLARKQDQMAQNIATLQAAVSQKVSASSSPPPAPKPVRVPPPAPKSLQPPAQ